MAIAMNRIGGKSNTGEGGEAQHIAMQKCRRNAKRRYRRYRANMSQPANQTWASCRFSNMKRMSSEKVYNSNSQDPLRFTQLEPGEFEAGAVKWDIVGGDTFRSKIKQAQSSRVLRVGGWIST